MLLVAILMILFGLAEVVTAFTHSFFGLTTSQAVLSTVIGAALGGCYFVGGLLLLTGRRWAATLAIVLLCIDVLGRFAMVLTGLYPLDSSRQTFGIVAGTAIAALFAIYVATQRNSFR
jgi:hypothetical protein